MGRGRLTAAAIAVGALRHGSLPRWIGWLSAVVAFLIAVMSAAMVPFMAFMPASLWLVATGIGLSRGPGRR